MAQTGRRPTRKIKAQRIVRLLFRDDRGYHAAPEWKASSRHLRLLPHRHRFPGGRPAHRGATPSQDLVNRMAKKPRFALDKT
jgi:hypothetical protein